MTVRLVNGVIRVEGICSVEEAETLLMLLEAHGAPVDLSACTHLHAAPFQVLLALGPEVIGPPAAPFARQFLWPHLSARALPPPATPA